MKTSDLAICAATTWLLASSTALADFTGHVVKVSDGDTLTVLVNKTQFRVRLDAIDAPESGQAFGKRSRQSLAQLCAAKDARVDDRGKDRYGRTIGRVTCAGLDANSEQVRRGMAWVFVRYAPKGSPLYGLESEARLAKRGLWADPRPVAPWEWRARKRSANETQLRLRFAACPGCV
jgi:endonuclease YncB( thermonuclease family)